MQYDRITIVSVAPLGEAGIRMVVRVELGGFVVTPDDLNPFDIVNPPTLVPDPHGDVVRESLRPDPDGEIVRSEVRNGRVVTGTFSETVETFAFDPRRVIAAEVRRHIDGLP